MQIEREAQKERGAQSERGVKIERGAQSERGAKIERGAQNERGLPCTHVYGTNSRKFKYIQNIKAYERGIIVNGF